MMADCYHGQAAIKDKGVAYLSPTPGQNIDGMDVGQLGYNNYKAYLSRARFPDFVRDAVMDKLGMAHHKAATIALPKRMEPLREHATIRGESLLMLLRRINESQLVTGRIGLLLDVPSGAGPDTIPYIATYDAASIPNWDDDKRDTLKLVVLDETRYERQNDLSWTQVDEFRFLVIDENGLYATGVAADSSKLPAVMVEPSIAGRTLTKLPFIFINACDLVPDPDYSPLRGLAELSLAVYRGEADYRQALFMQGQDTLVVKGQLDDEETTRMGAGAKICVTEQGDAKFIGVSSTGLSEMRQALENDKREASEVTGRLMNRSNGKAESGDALRIRVSAKTSSLLQVVLTGAEGLQTLLRIMAEWMGENPEEVVVTPNLDFADDIIDGQTLVNWMTAKNLGAPLSLRSIHDRLREKEMTLMTYEEELEEIAKETTDLAPAPNPDVNTAGTKETDEPAEE